MRNFFHGVEIIEVDEGFRNVQTTSSSVIGLIGVDAPNSDLPFDTPILLTGDKTEFLKQLGTQTPLAQAIQAIEDQQNSTIVLVRVAEGKDAEETLTNVIGGVDAETGAYTGLQAFCSAESAVHVVPKILIAPGLCKGGTADQADPVLTSLITIAEKLRAIIIADGPNSHDQAAIEAAQSAAHPRVYMVDPFVVNLSGDPVPASPYAAGVLSKVDTEKGF